LLVVVLGVVVGGEGDSQGVTGWSGGSQNGG